MSSFFILFEIVLFLCTRTAEEIGLICHNNSSSLMGVKADSEVMAGWEKVIDRDNLAAYRKPLPNSSYLYEYKGMCS